MATGHYSRHAVRASLVHFLAGRSMAMVLAFALLVLLVRALDTKAYGTYIALLSMLEIIQLISSAGLTLAAQRYIPELHAGRQVQALRRLVIGLLLGRACTLLVACAVCLPLATALAGWFGLEGASALIRFYLLVILFEGMARFVEVCQDSLLRQKASQMSTLLRTGLRLGLLLIWVAVIAPQGVDLQTWLRIDLAASVIGCFFSLASLLHFVFTLPMEQAATRDSGRLVQVAAPDIDLRRMARYLVPGFLAQVLYTGWGPDSVKLLAVRIAGTIQFAPFGFAMQLNTMLQRYMPVLLLLNLLRPLVVVARGREDYRVRLPLITGMLVKLNLFVLAPVLAFLLVMATPTADWLTGGRLPEAGDYLVLMAGMLAFQGTRLTLGLVSQALETGWATLIGTAVGSLGLLVGWWCTQWWGLRALVAGLALSELLCCLCLAAAIVQRGVPVGMHAAGLARIVLCIGGAALCTAACMWPLHAQPHVVTVPLAFLVCLLAFLVLARLVRPFRADERAEINGLLRRPLFIW